MVLAVGQLAPVELDEAIQFSTELADLGDRIRRLDPLSAMGNVRLDGFGMRTCLVRLAGIGIVGNASAQRTLGRIGQQARTAGRDNQASHDGPLPG
jgi:hypothetical protein